MIVNFYKLNERVGSISLVDGELVVKPHSLQFVLETPIVVRGVAYTADQPEQFLQNLRHIYRSPYLYAGSPSDLTKAESSNIALVVKHLPGQHDQSTHGHGGGGSSQIPNPPDDLVDDPAVKCMLKDIANDNWAYVNIVSEFGVGSLSTYANQLLDYHKLQAVSPEQHLAGGQFKPDGVTVDADTWTKSGGTLGTQPGGKFKAPDGEEYYVKFPNDPQVARNEVAAAKLYALTGAGVRDTFLVEKDGKVGVAAKWDEDLTKANFDKAEDRDVAASDFAVHAWTGNWDCVGAGYENPMDNIRFKGQGGDKQAVMLDPGGALFYSGTGTPKPFSKQASEWNSLRDASINPSSAKVFGKMTDEQLIESGKKVVDVSDEHIDKVCSQYNLPDGAAARLKSRRDYIKNKVQELEKKLQTGQPTSKEVEEATTPTGSKVQVQPKDGAVLAPPKLLAGKSQAAQAINNKFLKMHELASAGKWSELEAVKVKSDSKDHYIKKMYEYKQKLLSCKGGGAELLSKLEPATKTAQPINIKESLFPAKPEFVSSNQANVQANNKLADEALGYAKVGDIDSLKAMSLSPSPKLQEYHAKLVSSVAEQLTKSSPAKKTADKIRELADKFKVLIGQVEGTSKVGKYIALAEVSDDVAGSIAKKSKWSSKQEIEEYGIQGEEAFNKLTENEQDSVRWYTSSAYMKINDQLRSGGPIGTEEMKAAKSVMKSAIDLPEGLTLSRGLSLSLSDVTSLQNSVGKVLQDRGIVSTSLERGNWTSNVEVLMTLGPGVKGLPVDRISYSPGEKEVVLPPNTRMLVNKVEIGGILRVHATVLPTDPGQCCPP